MRTALLLLLLVALLGASATSAPEIVEGITDQKARGGDEPGEGEDAAVSEDSTAHHASTEEAAAVLVQPMNRHEPVLMEMKQQQPTKKPNKTKLSKTKEVKDFIKKNIEASGLKKVKKQNSTISPNLDQAKTEPQNIQKIPTIKTNAKNLSDNRKMGNGVGKGKTASVHNNEVGPVENVSVKPGSLHANVTVNKQPSPAHHPNNPSSLTAQPNVSVSTQPSPAHMPPLNPRPNMSTEPYNPPPQYSVNNQATNYSNMSTNQQAPNPINTAKLPDLSNVTRAPDMRNTAAVGNSTQANKPTDLVSPTRPAGALPPLQQQVNQQLDYKSGNTGRRSPSGKKQTLLSTASKEGTAFIENQQRGVVGKQAHSGHANKKADSPNGLKKPEAANQKAPMPDPKKMQDNSRKVVFSSSTKDESLKVGAGKEVPKNLATVNKK